MLKNVVLNSKTLAAGLLTVAVAAALSGCSRGSTEEVSTNDVRAVEMDARLARLEQREAEIAAKEQEQQQAQQQEEERARQQAEAAAAREREAAAKAAEAKKARPAPVRVASIAPPAKVPPPRPQPIDVPAGTSLTFALSSDLSSKTVKPGDVFEARLASDLMIDGRRAVPAGARVTGTVAEVVSGSNTIGAIPKLGLTFSTLDLENGARVAINGHYTAEGESEKGRDTAKILGGAAAGAVIGHQVNDDRRGTVIGGILGGAAGALAAKKTGTEVQLAAGSTVTVTLSSGFRVGG